LARAKRKHHDLAGTIGGRRVTCEVIDESKLPDAE
jgi:hypothetical protein